MGAAWQPDSCVSAHGIVGVPAPWPAKGPGPDPAGGKRGGYFSDEYLLFFWQIYLVAVSADYGSGFAGRILYPICSEKVVGEAEGLTLGITSALAPGL